MDQQKIQFQTNILHFEELCRATCTNYTFRLDQGIHSFSPLDVRFYSLLLLRKLVNDTNHSISASTDRKGGDFVCSINHE